MPPVRFFTQLRLRSQKRGKKRKRRHKSPSVPAEQRVSRKRGPAGGKMDSDSGELSEGELSPGKLFLPRSPTRSLLLYLQEPAARRPGKLRQTALQLLINTYEFGGFQAFWRLYARRVGATNGAREAGAAHGRVRQRLTLSGWLLGK